MSTKTWKAEYYTEPADAVDEKDALDHSLKKWRGLTADNLRRHGMRRMITDITDGKEVFRVDGKSCALCHHHACSPKVPLPKHCSNCPLKIFLGHPCDEDGPYNEWAESGNPEPMITALEGAEWFSKRRLQTINGEDLDEFTVACIEAALWSETGDDGVSLDETFTIHDLTHQTMMTIRDDCEQFQRDNFTILRKYDATAAGQDFWLTRNRHGAGYWDGSYQEPDGKRLTDAARDYGEMSLYISPDNKVHNR